MALYINGSYPGRVNMIRIKETKDIIDDNAKYLWAMGICWFGALSCLGAFIIVNSILLAVISIFLLLIAIWCNLERNIDIIRFEMRMLK